MEDFVITHDVDEDAGIVAIFCNLKLVVEWCYEDPDDVESYLSDFRKIFDLGVQSAKGK